VEAERARLINLDLKLKALKGYSIEQCKAVFPEIYSGEEAYIDSLDSLSSIYSGCCASDAGDREVEEMRRFRPEAAGIGLLDLEGPWDYSLGLYLHLLPENTRRVVKHYILTEYDVRRIKGTNNIKKFLGALSDHMKKFGEREHVDWLWMVDLHNLGGFVSRPSDDQVKEDARDWLSGTRTHKWFESDAKFNKYYQLGLDKALSRATGEPIRDYDVDYFLDNPELWATSGSSDWHAGDVLTNQGWRQMSKTKWGSAATLSRDEILRMLGLSGDKAATTIVFGPAGVGKSSVIKALNGTDLEDEGDSLSERRKALIDILDSKAGPTWIGGADIDPKDNLDGRYVNRVVLNLPYAEYMDRAGVRNYFHPDKGGQADSWAYFDRLKLDQVDASGEVSAVAERLENMLRAKTTKSAGHANIAIKQETKAARYIAATDLATNIKMNYISLWLEDILHNHPDTPLYWDDDHRASFWREWKDRIGTMMPEDQSRWDHEKSKLQLDMALAKLRKILQRYDNSRNRLLQVFDGIVYSMDNTWIKAVDDEFLMTKGILSGWRWTALLNTLINWGEIYGCIALLEAEYGYLDPVLKYNAQGDDVDLLLRSPGVAGAIYLLLLDAGFIVHPSKFFVSTTRNEYLRKVRTKDHRIVGYPARAVVSLLWPKPWLDPAPPGFVRLAEIYNNWMTAYGRGLDWEQIKPLMLRDLSLGSRISIRKIKKILSIHSVNGGLWAPGSPWPLEPRWRLTIEQPQKELKWLTVPKSVLVDAVGLPMTKVGVSDANKRKIEISVVEQVTTLKSPEVLESSVVEVVESGTPIFQTDANLAKSKSVSARLVKPVWQDWVPQGLSGPIVQAMLLHDEEDKLPDLMTGDSAKFYELLRSARGRKTAKLWVTQSIPKAYPAHVCFESFGLQRLNDSLTSAALGYFVLKASVGHDWFMRFVLGMAIQLAGWIPSELVVGV
jgi:energy-coupling factor transporter ATP-binding protein EcfA2